MATGLSMVLACSCYHRQHCSKPTGFFGPRQLSGDMQTWGLWQAYHGEALRGMTTMHHPNIESWQCWRLKRFNSVGSWYYFSELSVSVQALVGVFLSLAFVALFDSTSRVPFPRWCVLVHPHEVGCVWKMLRVREGHVPWSCHAECQTDSAPTTVTIRSWNRSSVLDTMYRSLRTFLPLWHKSLARVRTCKLPNNAHLVKAVLLLFLIIIWCIEPHSAFGWKRTYPLFIFPGTIM